MRTGTGPHGTAVLHTPGHRLVRAGAPGSRWSCWGRLERLGAEEPPGKPAAGGGQATGKRHGALYGPGGNLQQLGFKTTTKKAPKRG